MLKKLSLIRIEKIKILVQFLIMLVFSFAAGIFLVRIAAAGDTSALRAIVSKHFDAAFISCVSFSDVARAFINFFSFDFFALTITLIFTFSFINYVVSDLLIAFWGMKLGVCVSSFFCLTDSFDGANVFLYVTLRSLSILAFILYSYRMALHSLEIRRFGANGRLRLTMSGIIPIISSYASALGILLLLSGLYCLLIYIK